VSRPDQGRAVHELFGSDAAAYDVRQYQARYRTFIADRQVLVGRVFRELALPAGARVLDVACGPGRFLLEASSLGMVAVGIDASADMLHTAATHLGETARLVRGDAVALPFTCGAFDAVNCSGLIEYVPEPLPLLREILRVLKPDRHALVSSTNRLSPALLLSPLMAAARRSALARGLVRTLGLPFDDVSLRERRFRLTFHTPRRLIGLLSDAGFVAPDLHYYHLQLIPHPIDRLTPHAATACVRLTDRFLSFRPLGFLAEGLLAVGRRPARHPTGA
jgi:ubiquinone/menaquinone biosynthesis C-methylase UbiE